MVGRISGPARFLVPLLLPLALPAACAWAAAQSRRARVLLLAALVVSAWLSAVMTSGGGRLAYHTRNDAGLTAAPWLEWANPVVNLPAAFPAFVPQPVQPDPGGLVSRANASRAGFAATAIWIGCLGFAAWLLFWLFRRPDMAVHTMIATTTVAFALAAMVAISVVWRVHAAEPTTPTVAQMDVLHRLASGRVVALNLSGRRRLSRDEAWGMRIEAPIPAASSAAASIVRSPRSRPVPAGSYVVSVRRQAGADGWLMIGVGNDQFAIVTQPIAAFDWGVQVDVPVAVARPLVRADEGAREQLQSIELRPIGRAEPVSPDVARRAGATAPPRSSSSTTARFRNRQDSGWRGEESAIVLRPDLAAAGGRVAAQRGGRERRLAGIRTLAGRNHDEAGRGAPYRDPYRSHSRRRPAPHPLGRRFPSIGRDPNSRDTRFLGVFVRLIEP